MKYLKNLFDLISILNSYPIWTQRVIWVCVIIIFVCGTIILSLLILVPRTTHQTKESQRSNFTEINQQLQQVDGSIQKITTGDNSPIIEKIEVTSKQIVDIDYEVSPLMVKDGQYQREVIIRNNTSNPVYNVHFSLKSSERIINSPYPRPQGGGIIQTYYSKIVGNTYEAEVRDIPPRRYIKVVLQSNTEFEIKVTIYKNEDK